MPYRIGDISGKYMLEQELTDGILRVCGFRPEITQKEQKIRFNDPNGDAIVTGELKEVFRVAPQVTQSIVKMLQGRTTHVQAAFEELTGRKNFESVKGALNAVELAVGNTVGFRISTSDGRLMILDPHGDIITGITKQKMVFVTGEHATQWIIRNKGRVVIGSRTPGEEYGTPSNGTLIHLVDDRYRRFVASRSPPPIRKELQEVRLAAGKK